MADQGNQQLNKNKQRRVGGQLLLVFLFAAILIASLAAIAVAQDGPGQIIDPPVAQKELSAEELQYRQILQTANSPNAITPALVGCMPVGPPGSCKANDVRLGEITNINVTDPCVNTTTDTLTFTADWETIVGSQERYDIGLVINATGGGNGTAQSGTPDCLAANIDLVLLPDQEPPPPPPPYYVNDLETDPQVLNPDDTCGDLNTSLNPWVEMGTQFTVSCSLLNDDGELKVPYCITWDENDQTICDDPEDVVTTSNSKCNCDPNRVLANTVIIEKTGPVDATEAAATWPQFDYVINVTNNGPGVAKDIVVDDTLPTDVKYISSSITYPTGISGPTSCSIPAGGPIGNVGGYGGTVYCPGPGSTDFMPDIGANETIQITITVQVRPDLGPTETVINQACVDWRNHDEINDPVCDEVETTVPVTLSYFTASAAGSITTFDWSTSSETVNAGFNIYALEKGERIRLNDALILSNVVDSGAEQNYSLSLEGVQATTFYIEDVPVRGENRMHGPFELGEVYGAREEVLPIDWAVIRAEHEALAEERQLLASGLAMEKMETAQPAGSLAKLTAWAQNVVNSVLGKKTPLKKQISYPVFQLAVDRSGLHRLTYEDLVAATGVGLAGVPAAELALVDSSGNSVPIYVGGGNSFGPGSYVEFYGYALDTMYTDVNVFKLSIDAAKAERVSVVAENVPRNIQAAPYYMETATFSGNNRYSYLVTKSGDPWYDTLLLATKWKDWYFDMPVDNYVAVGGQGLLTMQIWGANDGNHHVKASFNGQQVADLFFLDQDTVDFAGAVDLQEGTNTLRLVVPNDQGLEFDMSRLEAYGLVYPRAFVARDDRLDFRGADDVYTVSNLSEPVAVVYRHVNGDWEKLTQLKTEADSDTYSVSFTGSSSPAYYFVATNAALLAPEVSLAVTPEGLLDGKVDLLLISHPSFIDGLAPLVAAREAQGYKVKVINVEEVYATYSNGVFDAEAIREYIHEAIDVMGVEYVLLVGGDTYDYRDFTNSGSMSFIPSLYAKTTDTVNFAPVDPLYTDIDFDNVPDAAIGRFPVRTNAELQLMINKTLQYEAKDYEETAVFAADSGFAYLSEDINSPLQSWAIEKAYLDRSDVASARATLINALNDGVALASFVGHSSRNRWTFVDLLKTSDVAKLTNYGEAAIVSQYGCWNTYYVDPKYDTMGHVFLLSGTNGAAAVTGSTTITRIQSEVELGQLLMPRLVQPGTTVGEAMQAAKAELAQSRPDYVDVLLGWTILGDPTTMVMP